MNKLKELIIIFSLFSSILYSASYDNNIEWYGVYSDTGQNFISDPEPSQKSEIKIRIRTFKNDVEVVYIKTSIQEIFPLSKISSSIDYDYYSANIKLKDQTLRYYFVLIDGTDIDNYGASGMSDLPPKEEDHFIIVPDFKTPRWVKESIFYQIFPDRFYDGDATNNVKDNEYIYLDQIAFTHKDWYERPKFQADFFGGDLRGIQNKIPYLQDLGINAIYLNPIFESLSNHKYDIKDYYTVDKHFGTNDDLSELVSLLHANGVKIILDGVFNHTSERNEWFDKYNEYKSGGAFEDQNSPFYNFYTFVKWPTEYFCWWGYDTLPKLNYDSGDVRDIIYRSGKDSISGRYISEFGINGWRLDVPNDAGGGGSSNDHSIWREFRGKIKSLSEDAFITGEIWDEPLPWLLGDQFDSVMGYHTFTEPLSNFITKKSSKGDKLIPSIPSEFDRDLRKRRNSYPYPSVMAILNSISSHDIPRFLERSDEKILNESDDGDSYPKEDDIKRLKLAMTFQLTYVGAPMIYYGDEVGQMGKKDPDNRRTFEWDYNKTGWKVELRDFVKKMIKLRKERRALIYGSFLTISANDVDGIFAYERFLNDERIFIVMNNSTNNVKTELSIYDFKDGELLVDYFTTKKYPLINGKLRLNLAPLEFFVLFKS